MAKITHLLIDLDGVIWREDTPIGDIEKVFSIINDNFDGFAFITNNSSKTNREFQKKLRLFGIDISEENIITSASASAEFISTRYPGKSVYCIGESGLLRTLEEYSIPLRNGIADIVLAGLDREFTYNKLEIAVRNILNGSIFIGTNPDVLFPTDSGFAPGAGTIIHSIAVSTGVKPLIIGKPNPNMYMQAIAHLKATETETLMIGDRLDSDILGAQKLRINSGLVFSGVSTEEDSINWEPPPTFIGDNIHSLLQRVLMHNEKEELDG